MNTPQVKPDRKSGVYTGRTIVSEQEGKTDDECKRNGHRDTGRGVCAECGKFL